MTRNEPTAPSVRPSAAAQGRDVVGPCLLAVIATIAVVAHVGAPVQTIAVFAFLPIWPGLAILGPLAWLTPMQRWVFGAAASVAVEMFIAEALSYAGHFSAATGVVLVAVVTVAAALLSFAWRFSPSRGRGHPSGG